MEIWVKRDEEKQKFYKKYIKKKSTPPQKKSLKDMRLEIKNVSQRTQHTQACHWDVPDSGVSHGIPEGGGKSQRKDPESKDISFLDSSPETKDDRENSLENPEGNAFDLGLHPSEPSTSWVLVKVSRASPNRLVHDFGSLSP